ncbi:MAG: hypothetical protein QGG39_11650, partial [Candidatus Poribacteria bacterium]|nr:hypothetical protein [Candidatus Poribacteria bacterium]
PKFLTMVGQPVYPVATSLTSLYSHPATHWHRLQILPAVLAGLPHYKQACFRQSWIADFQTQPGPHSTISDF